MSGNKHQNHALIFSLSFLVLAYFLRGGKHPLAFAVLFIGVCGLTHQLFLKDQTSFKISKRLFPFLFVLLWFFLAIFQAPPLNPFLVSFGKHVLAALWFLVIIRASNEKNADWIGWTVILLAAMETISVIGSYLLKGHISGYLAGNQVYSALLISSGLIYSVVQISSRSNIKQKSGLAFLVCFLILGLLVSNSRAVLIGVLLAIPCIISRKVATWVVLTCLSVLILIFLLHPTLFFNYLKIDPLRSDTWMGRIVIWKTAFLAINEKWFVGWGLGNFEAAYLKHQQPSGGLLRYSHTTIFAHNDFLQLAVTAGIPSLIFLFWGCKNLIHFPKDPKSLSPTGRWSLAVLIVYTITVFFNFPFYLPLHGMIVSSCLAIYAKETGFQFDYPINGRCGRWGIIGVLSIFCLFFSFNGLAEVAHSKKKENLAVILMPCRADYWYDMALEKINSGGDPAPFLRRALTWNSQDPFIWSRLGRVLMGTSPPPHDQIRVAFKTAVDLAPYHAPFWLDAGFYFLAIHDLNAAHNSFKQAAILEPFAPLPRFALGLLCMQRGEKQKAQRLYEMARHLKKKGEGRKGSSAYADYLFTIPAILSKS